MPIIRNHILDSATPQALHPHITALKANLRLLRDFLLLDILPLLDLNRSRSFLRLRTGFLLRVRGVSCLSLRAVLISNMAKLWSAWDGHVPDLRKLEQLYSSLPMASHSQKTSSKRCLEIPNKSNSARMQILFGVALIFKWALDRCATCKTCGAKRATQTRTC